MIVAAAFFDDDLFVHGTTSFENFYHENMA
jgi:hypothetical protein